MNDVPMPVDDEKMYGNLMRFVAPQKADGAVERPEFNPNSEGWPEMLDDGNRERIEQYVFRRIPDRLKVATAEGSVHIVFADERGRVMDSRIDNISDEQLLQLAKQVSGKTSFRPETNKTNHGYPKPQQEGVEEISEGKRFSIHKPAEADDKLGAAYRDVAALKADMDAMEEIPSNLKALYKQAMKAMDAITKARQETTQLRGMAKKASR